MKKRKKKTTNVVFIFSLSENETEEETAEVSRQEDSPAPADQKYSAPCEHLFFKGETQDVPIKNFALEKCKFDFRDLYDEEHIDGKILMLNGGFEIVGVG